MYLYFGLDTNKNFLMVSDKARLKPVSSASESSWKIYYTFQSAKNKGADQTAQVSVNAPKIALITNIRLRVG